MRAHFGKPRILWLPDHIHRLIFFSFQSHSENPTMMHEEKETLECPNQGEMSPIEEEIKESKSVVVIPFF